jgi:hypothetical protein
MNHRENWNGTALLEGEKTLWQGKPKVGMGISLEHFWDIVSGVFFLAIGLYVPSIQPGAEVMAALISVASIMLILYGFFMTPIRLFRTRYLLTNHRALVYTGIRFHAWHGILAFPLSDMKQAKLYWKPPNSVIFGEHTRMESFGASFSQHEVTRTIGFEHISNSSEIFELIQNACRKIEKPNG